MGKSKNDGRPRGVLTDRDRTFLKLSEEGRKEEYSPSARSRAWQDIKGRVWHSFLDGVTLFHHTTTDQRRAIFNGWEYFGQPPLPRDSEPSEYISDRKEHREKMSEKPRVDNGFRSWISFLYLGLSESDEFDFDTTLCAGIESAEESRGRVVTDLNFDFETRKRRSLGELAERLARRQKLTTEEIQRLRTVDVLDDDELVAYYDDLAEPVHGDGEE